MKIINKKIWRAGNSYVVTVPSAYVEHGHLELEKEYDYVIVPSKKNKEE
jgi:antitoxin component of MazEF toxin-antitoxin module